MKIRFGLLIGIVVVELIVIGFSTIGRAHVGTLNMIEADC